jgi:transcriptional regulator GlxA family with amidase domain
VGSSNDAQRIAACSRFLIRSINLDRETRYVRRALECIMLARGSISVESLATLVGTSRRSLESAFRREVGASPKMYCRITRFRHLFDAVSRSDPAVDWVQAALDSGFFDQSHMIHDFRRFAGRSPTSFLADSTPFARSVNQV